MTPRRSVHSIWPLAILLAFPSGSRAEDLLEPYPAPISLSRDPDLKKVTAEGDSASSGLLPGAFELKVEPSDRASSDDGNSSGQTSKGLILEPIQLDFCQENWIPKSNRSCSTYIKTQVEKNCDLFFIWRFGQEWETHCKYPSYCNTGNLPREDRCDETMKSRVMESCSVPFQRSYQTAWDRHCAPCEEAPSPVEFDDCTVDVLDIVEKNCNTKQFRDFASRCDEVVKNYLAENVTEDQVDGQCLDRTRVVHAPYEFTDHLQGGSGSINYYCFDQGSEDSGCLFDEQVNRIKEPWGQVSVCEIPYDFRGDYHVGTPTHVYTRANYARSYSSGVQTATHVEQQNQILSAKHLALTSIDDSEPMIFDEAAEVVEERMRETSDFYDELAFLDELDQGQTIMSVALRTSPGSGSQIEKGIEGLAEERMTWEQNGSRVESCHEYIYERFYLYNKFRTFSEALGTDYRAIFDLAYGRLPAIDPNGEGKIVNSNIHRRKKPDRDESIGKWTADPENGTGGDVPSGEPQQKNIFHFVEVGSDQRMRQCYESSADKESLKACFKQGAIQYSGQAARNIVLLDSALAQKIQEAISAHPEEARDWRWHEEMSDALFQAGYSDEQLYIFDMMKEDFP